MLRHAMPSVDTALRMTVTFFMAARLRSDGATDHRPCRPIRMRRALQEIDEPPIRVSLGTRRRVTSSFSSWSQLTPRAPQADLAWLERCWPGSRALQLRHDPPRVS